MSEFLPVSMALHHGLIECLFIMSLYFLVSLMKMSYPHKHAYSSLSLQADCLYEIQDSSPFIRHILFCCVSCTLFPFVPIVLREFQSKNFPSFYTTSFSPVLLSSLVGCTLFESCVHLHLGPLFWNTNMCRTLTSASVVL